MDHDEAVAQLGDSNTDTRRDAARALIHLAKPDDRAAITRALRVESDIYAKAALRRALRAIVPQTALIVSSPASDSDELIYADIYAKAVEETSARIVHELRRVIGMVRLSALAEVPDWDDSATNADLSRLQALMESIDRLSRAASAPAIEEFDLADVVDQVIRAEVAQGARIDRVGRAPLVALGDRFLVDMTLQNGLRNAVEAVQAAESTEPIIVSWGDTDRDYWVTVSDRGNGLPLRSDLFQLGATTKDRNFHNGVGLALAGQAVQSLGGVLTLSNREDGGVSYELRWPR